MFYRKWEADTFIWLSLRLNVIIIENLRVCQPELCWKDFSIWDILANIAREKIWIIQYFRTVIRGRCFGPRMNVLYIAV